MATNSESDGSVVDWGPFFETSPVPTFVQKPESGDIVDVNEACEPLFGYDVATLREMDVAEFTVGIENAAERVAAAFERTMENGAETFDWQIERPDGSRAEVQVELRRATIEDADRIVAYVTDVTERRKRERILDELQTVAQALMDADSATAVADITTSAAEETIDFTYASLRLRSSDYLALESMTSASVDLFPDGPHEVPVDDGFMGRTYQSGEMQVVDDLRTHEDGITTDAIRSAICIPLGRHGVFTVGGQEVGQFDATDLEFATLLTRLSEAALDQIERKQQFEARTHELETLLNNAPIIFYQVDPDGTVVEARGRALASLGLEPEDVVGQDIFGMYEHVPRIHEMAERALEGEPVHDTVKLGEQWFETSYQPVVTDGTVDRVIGVSVDVTDQKRVEQQFAGLSDASIGLSQSATRTAAIERTIDIATEVLDEPVAAFWERDAEERLVAHTISDGAEVLVGGTEQELTHSRGDPIWEVFDADETVVDNDFDPETTAAESDIRSVILAPVGEHGLLTIGSPTADAYDDQTRDMINTLAGMVRTLLDRLGYEEQLQESRTELERSNENLQQFAYVASHDLQEPLRMVASYVDLLDKEYGDDLDDEAREYMDFAVDGAHRMQDMVNGLLKYARVETRGGEPETIDPNRVFDETLDDLQFQIEETGTDVRTEPMPFVEADARQLGQLFQNLIDNAMTYASENGDPRIEIHATKGDESVEFAVSDDGPGIPDRFHDSIFEVFERGDSMDTEGTGIGLSVCQRIVARHDGDIWVDSDVEDGTTIRFTLPAARDSDLPEGRDDD